MIDIKSKILNYKSRKSNSIYRILYLDNVSNFEYGRSEQQRFFYITEAKATE